MSTIVRIDSTPAEEAKIPDLIGAIDLLTGIFDDKTVEAWSELDDATPLGSDVPPALTKAQSSKLRSIAANLVQLADVYGVES